jgi:hypothetical protein
MKSLHVEGTLKIKLESWRFGIPPSSGRYSARNGLVANLEQTIENYVATLSFYSQGSLHIAPKMGEALRNIGLVADEAERARGFTAISLMAKTESQGTHFGSDKRRVAKSKCNWESNQSAERAQ